MFLWIDTLITPPATTNVLVEKNSNILLLVADGVIDNVNPLEDN